jgi:hypothetical protein
VTDCFTGTFAMDTQTGALVGDGPLISNPPGVLDVEGVIVRRDGSLLLSGYAE